MHDDTLMKPRPLRGHAAAMSCIYLVPCVRASAPWATAPALPVALCGCCDPPCLFSSLPTGREPSLEGATLLAVAREDAFGLALP